MWGRRGIRRRDREDDLERELQSHLDLVAAEEEKNGLNPEEARYAARRVLGSPTRVKEDVRDMWAWNRLSIVAQDLRHAFRTLLKSPGFAITAFLTLALGTGASTAVFTLVDSVILKPLAYRDSGRLVTLWERIPLMSPDPDGPNPRHADLWQKQATAFKSMALELQTLRVRVFAFRLAMLSRLRRCRRGPATVRRRALRRSGRRVK